MLKMLFQSLFGGLIQQTFKFEIEEYLWYSKYNYTNKNTTNSHNRQSKKTVKYDLVLFYLYIPKNRDGSF